MKNQNVIRIFSIFALLVCSLFGSFRVFASSAALEAIVANHADRLQAEIDRGLDINKPLADGSSLLAWAVDAQNPQLVRLLLEQGAKPNLLLEDNSTFSPLIVACQRGKPEIVFELLKAGADIYARASQGVSALSLCAGQSSLEAVSALIDQGAKVNARDANGQTALMRAAYKGRVDIIDLLLERGADLHQLTNAGFNALFFAIKATSSEAAHLLLDRGADADHVLDDATTAVKLAMYQKKYDIAARLIERGADLKAYDRNGNQLLHAAVLANQPKLVRLLIKKGADPDALTGESEVVWRYEVNFTSAPYIVYPKSPLLLAAENGASEIVQLLVDAGADTKFRSEDGTNIVLASARSNPETLALALKLAPDANIVNKSGRTPLHLLLSLGTENPITAEQISMMFQLLADRGAAITTPDKNGVTPLAMANGDQYRSKEDFNLIFNQNDEAEL